MLPLIYTQHTYLLIFVLIFLLWASSEFLGPVRWGQARQGQRRDRRSILFGAILGLVGIGFAVVSPLLMPGLTMGQPAMFACGCV